MKGLLAIRVNRALLSIPLLYLMLAGCGGSGGSGNEVAALHNAAEKQVKTIAITDLGTLGGSYSKAVDVNEKGQVIGESTTSSGDTHAFIWQNGVMTDLGTLGGSYSTAVDVNEKGEVVGESTTSSGVTHAFIWHKGVLTDLGTLGPASDSSSSAYAINNSGQVVGKNTTASGATQAFFWQNGIMTDLGTLGGNSQAVGINENGQVVGTSRNHAFIWQDGVMTDLGMPNSLIFYTFAIAINNKGQIICEADTPYDAFGAMFDGIVWTLFSWGQAVYPHAINENGQVVGQYSGMIINHAFIWKDGVMTDLGVLPGATSPTSGAVAINEIGQVVGSSSAASGATHAVIWQNGVITDLGSLGPADSSNNAYAINNKGQVVGLSDTAVGERHATLWSTH